MAVRAPHHSKSIFGQSQYGRSIVTLRPQVLPGMKSRFLFCDGNVAVLHDTERPDTLSISYGV